MASAKTFLDERLIGAQFKTCAMAEAKFDDVDLARAKFNDVNLQGANFDNINMSNVVITDAKIDGLTIFGWDIAELIRDARKRKQSGG